MCNFFEGYVLFLEKYVRVRIHRLRSYIQPFPDGGVISPTPLLMTTGVVHRINPGAQSHVPFRFSLRGYVYKSLKHHRPPIYVTPPTFLKENRAEIYLCTLELSTNIYVPLFGQTEIISPFEEKYSWNVYINRGTIQFIQTTLICIWSRECELSINNKNK